jgi:hypothetical protein
MRIAPDPAPRAHGVERLPRGLRPHILRDGERARRHRPFFVQESEDKGLGVAGRVGTADRRRLALHRAKNKAQAFGHFVDLHVIRLPDDQATCQSSFAATKDLLAFPRCSVRVTTVLVSNSSPVHPA